MKTFTYTIILITACLITSCKATNEEATVTEIIPIKTEVLTPGFIHAVYFWFNEDADPKLKADFLNGLDELAKVESIQSVYYGPPADTDRAVVDNTYDYAWITNFESAEDHDSYQVDAIHLEFIEKYKTLWKEVKVYDNLVK